MAAHQGFGEMCQLIETDAPKLKVAGGMTSWDGLASSTAPPAQPAELPASPDPRGNTPPPMIIGPTVTIRRHKTPKPRS
ncbi:MAG: hypothetical protein ACHQAQ_15755, partial [Hyphomicrobiales bacterium]